jgi:predicted peroxiredoxin
MKKAGLFLIPLLAVLALTEISSQRIPDDNTIAARDGVFIHMTHDHKDPHRVLMPLQMASIMANDKDVLVYLDIDAVNLVTRDARDVYHSHFAPLKASIDYLLNNGVNIYACPGCMKAAGIVEADLIDGVMVAEKERFFDFTQGRIITLNY